MANVASAETLRRRQKASDLKKLGYTHAEISDQMNIPLGSVDRLLAGYKGKRVTWDFSQHDLTSKLEETICTLTN